MLQIDEQKTQLLPVIRAWKQRHPGMSARLLYELIKPDWIGRDGFERFCMQSGFRVKKCVARFKTTQSGTRNPFPNLLEDRWLTGINQVWVSDITYVQLTRQLVYLTLLMDLWSRFIVGYHLSTSLRTGDTTLPVLRMALKTRSPAPGLIFHSDGGGQYYSHELLELTLRTGIVNSMGRGVYENSQAERLNETIKNQYLGYYEPGTLQEIKKLTKKVIYLYNYERPHASLNKTTPAYYETLKSLPRKKIWHETYTKKHHVLILKTP